MIRRERGDAVRAVEFIFILEVSAERVHPVGRSNFCYKRPERSDGLDGKEASVRLEVIIEPVFFAPHLLVDEPDEIIVFVLERVDIVRDAELLRHHYKIFAAHRRLQSRVYP